MSPLVLLQFAKLAAPVLIEMIKLAQIAIADRQRGPERKTVVMNWLLAHWIETGGAFFDEHGTKFVFCEWDEAEKHLPVMIDRHVGLLNELGALEHA